MKRMFFSSFHLFFRLLVQQGIISSYTCMLHLALANHIACVDLELFHFGLYETILGPRPRSVIPLSVLPRCDNSQ